MSLFAELKRRNVFRVGVAYAVASWVFLQVVDLLTPMLGLPDWAPRLVFAILAVGLLPALVFSWAFEITPEGIKREREVVRSQSVTHQTAKKLDQVTIGLLVVVVAVIIVDRNFSPAVDSSTSGNAQTNRSIAVLAFEDLSQDGDQAYFAEGLSEELLNLLAKTPELQVAGRTSSFAFKGEHRDLREIGEILNVAHVLEGSVRKAGNTIRVTAQLVSTADGFHLFSETYDDQLSDIFKVQDDIARQITTALKAQLIGESAVPDSAVTDVRAYELYLEARQKIHTRDGQQLNEASELLDAALIIDPDYPPALAQKAMALALLSSAPGSYGDIPQEIAYAEANKHLDKALEIDPDLAEAHAVRGLILRWDNRGEESMRHLRRAVEINPNLDDANLWLSTLLGWLGRDEARTELLHEIIERDPLFPPAFSNLVNDYLARREVDRTTRLIDRYERAAGTDSSSLQARAQVAWVSSEHPEAVRLFQQAYDLDPSSTVLRNGYGTLLRLLGNYDAMRSLDLPHLNALAELLTTGEYDPGPVEAAYPPGADIRYLNWHTFAWAMTGQIPRILQVVEEDYGGLDNLLANNPESGSSGLGYSIYVAYAYRELGQQEEFDKIMTAMREALDAQRQRHRDPIDYWYGEVAYAALDRNPDALVLAFENVVDLGEVHVDPVINPVLAPYRNEPRLQPVLETLRSRAAAARAELGWEPYQRSL